VQRRTLMLSGATLLLGLGVGFAVAVWQQSGDDALQPFAERLRADVANAGSAAEAQDAISALRSYWAARAQAGDLSPADRRAAADAFRAIADRSLRGAPTADGLIRADLEQAAVLRSPDAPLDDAELALLQARAAWRLAHDAPGADAELDTAAMILRARDASSRDRPRAARVRAGIESLRAELALAANEPAQALSLADAGIAALQRVPASKSRDALEAGLLESRGSAAARMDRLAAAAGDFEALLQLRARGLADTEPGPDARIAVALAAVNLGRVELARRHPQAALDRFEYAREQTATNAASGDEALRIARLQWQIARQQARTLVVLGREDEAVATLLEGAEALQIESGLADAQRSVLAEDHATALEALAEFQSALGRTPAACEGWLRAAQAWQRSGSPRAPLRVDAIEAARQDCGASA